ncbi:MAG: hypothetical protein KF812_10200 [Fimbriimonadaceae bacterium]|nr:hypothetical protein [Fimbriimonadaceae bacterium]
MPAKKKTTPSSKRKPSQAVTATKKSVVRPVAKKKPSRKPRRPIAWDRWLWAAATVNIIAGFFYSPVTTLRSVRVVGVAAEDHVAVEQALQGARDRSFAQLTDATIIGPLYNLERVETASISRNIFGRGVLTVQSPTVLATVDGHDNLFMTTTGDLRSDLLSPENVPVIRLPADEFSETPALVSLTPIDVVAGLVQQTTERWPDQDWMVHVDNGGVLSLRKVNGPVVLFGVASKIDEKVGALDQILQTQPELADRAVRITLTEPSAPAIAPLVLERS